MQLNKYWIPGPLLCPSSKNKKSKKKNFLKKKKKKILYFGKWNLLAPSLKTSYTFSKKNLYISGVNLPSPKNKTFLSFSDDISGNGSFYPQI